MLTSGNIDQVSSPFDPNDDRTAQSMSEVDNFGLTGAGFVYGEFDNAFSVTFIGGYGLSASVGRSPGGLDSHPWAFEVDPGEVGRLTVDKFRVEVKGGLVDVAAGAQLAEPYLDSDNYPAGTNIGNPRIRLNSGATMTDADMVRADDYGGIASPSALVDGTNCAVGTSIMRLGIHETVGTCRTTGLGNTISGTTAYDNSLPPNYDITASTSATWVKLGTWVSHAPGTLGISFYTGVGFTSGANNQSMAEAIIRIGNGAAAPNISGASVFSRGGSAITGIKVVATGGSTSITNSSWDIYIDEMALATGNFVINKATFDEWINAGAITADPGSASSTVAVGDVQSVVTVPAGTGGATKTCTVLPTVVNGIVTGC